MANIYKGNVISIDTFTSAIDFATKFPNGQKIQSIEWAKPTNITHTAYVQVGGVTGPKIFDEQCITVNDSLIKYYYNEWFASLYIPIKTATLFASGSLIIILGDGMSCGEAP